MDDDFLNPEDEYDLLHEDEMDVLREMEHGFPVSKSATSAQNLDVRFQRDNNDRAVLYDVEDDDDEEGNLIIDLPSEISGKRQLSVESLCGPNGEISYIEPPAKKLRHEIRTEKEEFNFHQHCGTTSLRFPKWPFVTFNTYDGERFYVKFREEDNDICLENFYKKSIKTDLLGDSYVNIKSLAEKTLELCLKRAEAELLYDNSQPEGNSELWVEKYKPKSYLELLSDEGVNRSLLSWLKKWDKVVFNKIKKKKIENDENRSNNQNRFESNSEDNDGLDPDGRPHHKIALLCGPPGLGKTTLAHVIAHVAGYSVIEVNASDDRTIEAFHSKLEAATQMQSVVGSNKPNCLILDEIDGAPSSSVEYLLKYINGKTSQKGGGSKKEKTKGAIKRPVICICNEPYVPALRQLRQQAYVVHFPHTSYSRLAQRLLEICRKQNIKTDLSTMTLLCDKMESDIRCCISTLHFFKINNGQSFRPSDVAKCSVGEKDLQKGLFSMWHEIFQISFKNKLFTNSGGNSVDDILGAHYHYSPKNMEKLKYLVQLFQSCGDFERLVQGVYENFLNMKFSRTHQSMSRGLDWFCWTDIIDTNIKELQNYSLMPYLPYAFAAWHFLFAVRTYGKINFPKTSYENYMKEVKTKQILSDILRGLNPAIRSHTCSLQLILDVLPMLRIILVPPLRPISINLFSEREKKDFHNLISIMIDYNLNYLHQRAPDGTFYYEFDPNIREIIEFGDEMEKTKPSFSFNMKQLIARELDIEKLRRTENHDEEPEIMTNKMEEQKEKIIPEPKLPNHLQKLIPKEVKVDNIDGAQYKDFFGRIVKAKPSTVLKDAHRSDDGYKSKLWFTYKEGFNNAVKKDITIAYLL